MGVLEYYKLNRTDQPGHRNIFAVLIKVCLIIQEAQYFTYFIWTKPSGDQIILFQFPATVSVTVRHVYESNIHVHEFTQKQKKKIQPDRVTVIKMPNLSLCHF